MIMIPNKFDKYFGGWINDNYKMFLFSNQEFFLKYKDNIYDLKRVGASKIIGHNELVLNSWYIINEFTNTLIDDDDSIIFQLNENGALESKDIGTELKKQHFNPYE